jgi:hypothetical protein
MPIRFLVLALLLSFLSPLAFSCECSNNTPIERNLEHYRERAVFTAHVLQVIGRPYERDGKRYSDLVLAVVHQKYWGLPWYWPKIVLLEGGGFCGMLLTEGEDYLVSGRRWRYGVVGVGVCSRTQTIDRAQVDLRTLDGSLCSAPGGTLIGEIRGAYGDDQTDKHYPNETLSLRSSGGRTYSATSDSSGIFAFQHLPIGDYTFSPNLGANRYISVRDDSRFGVQDGECFDASVAERSYILRARIAGLRRQSFSNFPESAKVELVPLQANSNTKTVPAEDAADGNFFFTDVPPGEYLLGLNITAPPTQGRPFATTYYPGTGDPQKAERIKIGQQPLTRTFEFSGKRMATTALPIVVKFPDGTLVPAWFADLEINWPDKNHWVTAGDAMGWSTDWGGFTGIVGQHYRVRARESTNGQAMGTERCSERLEFDAKPNQSPLTVVLAHRCAQPH